LTYKLKNKLESIQHFYLFNRFLFKEKKIIKMSNTSYTTCHICQYVALDADNLYLHVQKKKCIPSIDTTINTNSPLFEQMDEIMDEADITEDASMDENTRNEGEYINFDILTRCYTDTYYIKRNHPRKSS
jgi:hypothetical protein